MAEISEKFFKPATEAYSESCQAFKIKRPAKIVNSF